MLWLRPLADGVKIIAVGHTRASIWASWPAPLGIRRVVYRSSWAQRSTRSTMSGSNSTGSNRASERRSIVTCSASASRSHSAASRRSAAASTDSSVLRRSTVIVTTDGTTFTRFGRTSTRPTVAT